MDVRIHPWKGRPHSGDGLLDLENLTLLLCMPGHGAVGEF